MRSGTSIIFSAIQFKIQHALLFFYSTRPVFDLKVNYNFLNMHCILQQIFIPTRESKISTEFCDGYLKMNYATEKHAPT